MLFSSCGTDSCCNCLCSRPWTDLGSQWGNATLGFRTSRFGFSSDHVAKRSEALSGHGRLICSICQLNLRWLSHAVNPHRWPCQCPVSVTVHSVPKSWSGTSGYTYRCISATIQSMTTLYKLQAIITFSVELGSMMAGSRMCCKN